MAETDPPGQVRLDLVNLLFVTLSVPYPKSSNELDFPALRFDQSLSRRQVLDRLDAFLPLLLQGVEHRMGSVLLSVVVDRVFDPLPVDAEQLAR